MVMICSLVTQHSFGEYIEFLFEIQSEIEKPYFKSINACEDFCVVVAATGVSAGG
jgi:hypothetical protein